MSQASEACWAGSKAAPRQACNGQIECPPKSPRHCAADRRPHRYCLRIGLPARPLGFEWPPPERSPSYRKTQHSAGHPEMDPQPSVNRSVDGGSLSSTGPLKAVKPRICPYGGRADCAGRPLMACHAGRRRKEHARLSNGIRLPHARRSTYRRKVWETSINGYLSTSGCTRGFCRRSDWTLAGFGRAEPVGRVWHRQPQRRRGSIGSTSCEETLALSVQRRAGAREAVNLPGAGGAGPATGPTKAITRRLRGAPSGPQTI